MVEDASTDNKSVSASPKNQKRNRYTDELKAEILVRAAEIGIRKAAKEYNVSNESVRLWKKKAENQTTSDISAEETAADSTPVDETVQTAEDNTVNRTSMAEPTVIEETLKTEPEVIETESNAPVDNVNPASTIAPSKTDTVIRKLSVSLEIENAVLKAENATLKEQIEKLRKKGTERVDVINICRIILPLEKLLDKW